MRTTINGRLGAAVESVKDVIRKKITLNIPGSKEIVKDRDVLLVTKRKVIMKTFMITKWASVTVSSALAAPKDRKRSFLTTTTLFMDSALDQPAPIVTRKPHLILETLIL